MPDISSAWKEQLKKAIGPPLDALLDSNDVDSHIREFIGKEYLEIIDFLIPFSKAQDVEEAAKLLAAFFEDDLKKWNSPPGVGFTLHKSLSDGNLTSQEVGHFAAFLALSQLPDGNTKRLVEAITAESWASSSVVDGILAWAKKHFGESVFRDLDQALKDDPLPHAKDVMLVLLAPLAPRILKVGAPASYSDYASSFLSALNDWVPPADSPVRALLLALIKANDEESLINLVKVLRLENTQLGQLVTKPLREAVVNRLTDLLAGKGVEAGPARELAEAVMEVIEGKREILANSEKEAVEKLGLPYDLWLRVRKCVFLAKRSIAAGALVSVQTNSKPLLFQMSTILPTDKVTDHAGTETKEWNAFAVYFNMIAGSEFRLREVAPDYPGPLLGKRVDPIMELRALTDRIWSVIP
jgi:hypothetical protein